MPGYIVGLVIIAVLAVLIIIIAEVVIWCVESSFDHYPIDFRTFETLYNEHIELRLGSICINYRSNNRLTWNYFYFSPWQHFFLYLPFYICENRRIKRMKTKKILETIKDSYKENSDSQK